MCIAYIPHSTQQSRLIIVCNSWTPLELHKTLYHYIICNRVIHCTVCVHKVQLWDIQEAVNGINALACV